jgi:hypothetical protein
MSGHQPGHWDASYLKLEALFWRAGRVNLCFPHSSELRLAPGRDWRRGQVRIYLVVWEISEGF